MAAGRRSGEADLRLRRRRGAGLPRGVGPRPARTSLSRGRFRLHLARRAGLSLASGRVCRRSRVVSVRHGVPPCARGRDDYPAGCRRLAWHLRRRRDRQASLLRRLVLATRTHVVAVNRELRTRDSGPGTVAGPPSRSRRGAGRGAPGYFTAKQVKEVAPRTDSFRPSPGVHFLQSPGAPRTRRRFRGGAISWPLLNGPARGLSSPALFHRQASNRLEDAVGLLDLLADPLADRASVGRFAYGDHVVLAGDGVGGRDATHAFHLLGHLQGAPRRRVDQDIGLHPLTPFLLGGRNCLSLLASAGLGLCLLLPGALVRQLLGKVFQPRVDGHDLRTADLLVARLDVRSLAR